MAVLSDLEKGYGERLYTCTNTLATYNANNYAVKILLLHAGGYSKRLPNHSLSGYVSCMQQV